jgi:hypothetical protein
MPALDDAVALAADIQEAAKLPPDGLTRPDRRVILQTALLLRAVELLEEIATNTAP